MKKNLMFCLVFMLAGSLPLSAAELYGYVDALRLSEETEQFIILDTNQPVIGVTDGVLSRANSVSTLTVSSYMSYSFGGMTMLEALMEARAKNWFVKFTVNALAENTLISAVEVPASPAARKQLTAEYLFNGNPGDTSGNANTLTGYNGTAVQDSAALFDGTDDGLGRAYLNNFNRKAITLTAWIKAKMGKGCSRIVEIGENYTDSTAFVIDSDTGGTVMGFRYWVHTDTDDARIAAEAGTDYDYHDNQWHQVVLTYDSTLAVMYLYIDGKKAGSRAATGLINSQQELNIGNLDSVDGGADHPYSGLIDNVRIYGRALTAAEVSLCYAVEQFEHE